MPSYTAVPFLVTAPVINSMVLFATYSAFGNSIQMALLRAIGSILVATVLGIFLGFSKQLLFNGPTARKSMFMTFKLSAGQRFFQVFVQAIDEFFDTGRYSGLRLFFASGSGLCANSVLTSISATPVLAILLLMLLSFLLSFVVRRTPFIGSSLSASFGLAPRFSLSWLSDLCWMSRTLDDEELSDQSLYCPLISIR